MGKRNRAAPTAGSVVRPDPYEVVHSLALIRQRSRNINRAIERKPQDPSGNRNSN